MAAKVVMVAVPTVLGIASIRVYTVSEAPADGLVRKEQLNIYTPLGASAQVKFVQETPGLIERGLTTTREGVLPAYRAVKDACASVKKGTVNLYHGGQDVYYYLKDPPPEFLPRFGTITMAGLLGMFLARKGSRFNRLAVPLGLMTAGASVCYPAQAVAVCKVTGRKVYAAGQWSSAAVSSLFAAKEPVAKEVAASQPQTATVPNPESAASPEASEPTSAAESPVQSPPASESEVESAESAPVSDEPVGAVITKEAAPVTLTEASPDPAPTETGAGITGVPAPLGSQEASDSQQASVEVSADTSPTEAAASSEPETIEAAPVAPAEVEPAAGAEPPPVDAGTDAVAPVEASYAEAAPPEVAPVEVAPVEAAPVEVAAEVAPVEAAPVEAAPVDAAPVDAAPVEAVPVAPVEAAPVDAAPVDAAPVDAAPVDAAPVDAAPVDAAPVDAALVAVPDVSGVESAEPESADRPAVAAEETPAEPTTPPAAAEEPTTEKSREGTGFKPDPSLLDFGQSSPEDADLYTTRS